MPSEKPMPQEPEFDLEALLAAEEAAIKDDGFSKRVVAEAGRSRGVRKVTLYGAGMVGFGIAAGSIVNAAQDMPSWTGWLTRVNTEVNTALTNTASTDVGSLAQSSGMPLMMAGAALAGVILSAVALLSTQNR